jgi:hypothetical protein
MRPRFVGFQANSDQHWQSSNAIGLNWKKEKALLLVPEENAFQNIAKPWISNRKLSAVFGTALTPSHFGTRTAWWAMEGNVL